MDQRLAHKVYNEKCEELESIQLVWLDPNHKIKRALWNTIIEAYRKRFAGQIIQTPYDRRFTIAYILGNMDGKMVLCDAEDCEFYTQLVPLNCAVSSISVSLLEIDNVVIVGILDLLNSAGHDTNNLKIVNPSVNWWILRCTYSLGLPQIFYVVYRMPTHELAMAELKQHYHFAFITRVERYLRDAWHEIEWRIEI